MCGIVGIIKNNKRTIADNINSVNNMLSVLNKRGPDDSGVFSDNVCVLGQTRLSIIDLDTGHQPMKDNVHNIAITFNGEIYNYKELRKNLEKKGHVFSTKSDTEVILKTYIEYGDECPKYLDGMFAFVIWNSDTKKLFAARDRFGKKPLYYTLHESQFIFASEIKALFKIGIRGTIDYGAIDNYLSLMYIPPWKSVYSNIHVLPPAHILSYINENVKIKKYWSLQNKPINIQYQNAKKKINELINKAVRKRLIANVEIGALLSGGVDSTLVTERAQQHVTKPIKTFSVSYTGHSSDESKYAQQASETIGTDHYTLETSYVSIEELTKVIEYMDEPHADSSNFPQHLVSLLASSKVKVALSGDGADELFMGYGWYWKYWNTRKIAQLKNSFFSTPFKEYIKNISVFTTKERKKIWKNLNVINEDFIPKEINKEKNQLKKINLFDILVYLPGQLLSKIDRTGMMHSLEIRSPFLDTELAEFIYNIPTEYKMDKHMGKIILKDILSDSMSKEFVYRRKQGFGAPVQEWIEEKNIAQYISDLFNGEAKIYKFLNRDEVINIVERFYKGQKDLYYKVWSLVCLEIWFKSHVL